MPERSHTQRSDRPRWTFPMTSNTLYIEVPWQILSTLRDLLYSQFHWFLSNSKAIFHRHSCIPFLLRGKKMPHKHNKIIPQWFKCRNGSKTSKDSPVITVTISNYLPLTCGKWYERLPACILRTVTENGPEQLLEESYPNFSQLRKLDYLSKIEQNRGKMLSCEWTHGGISYLAMHK